MNDNVTLHLYQIRKYPNLTYACFQHGHCADQLRMPLLQLACEVVVQGISFSPITTASSQMNVRIDDIVKLYKAICNPKVFPFLTIMNNSQH
jgi:hypothetical protein